MGRSRLFAVFMVVFIGLMGFSILIPLLPAFAEDFGANETVQGLLVASYAALQLIGAPILGSLSDRYGRRPILLVSVFGTFISLLMLGFANALWILFFSRMLDGLTGGNISVAQAYITDITDEKNRARGLGLVGAAFGLGFIVGPALGGILSGIGTDVIAPAVAETDSAFLQSLNWTYALPAFVAAGIGFINLLQVFFQLPESLTEERRAELKEKQKRKTGRLSPSAILGSLSRPLVGPLLNMRLLFSLAFSMFQTVFPIYAGVQLGLNPSEIAFVLTYVGVIVVIVQGVAIGKLTDRFAEPDLLFVSTVSMTIGLVLWAIAPSVPVLLISLIPISFAGGVFNAVINSALTNVADSNEAGEILGVSTSLESFTRVITPPIGGWMIGNIGSWSPGILCAVIVALTALYTWKRVVSERVYYGDKKKVEAVN